MSLSTDPCEYGCDGICDDIEHWRWRADYLREAGENHSERANAWREEAWQCYLASGADPDGADARHLNPGEAIAAVRELRDESDVAYARGYTDGVLAEDAGAADTATLEDTAEAPK